MFFFGCFCSKYSKKMLKMGIFGKRWGSRRPVTGSKSHQQALLADPTQWGVTRISTGQVWTNCSLSPGGDVREAHTSLMRGGGPDAPSYLETEGDPENFRFYGLAKARMPGQDWSKFPDFLLTISPKNAHFLELFGGGSSHPVDPLGVLKQKEGVISLVNRERFFSFSSQFFPHFLNLN